MLGLMDYMNMCQSIPFRVSAFTSIEDMDIEGMDVLLTDTSFEIYDKNLPVVKLVEAEDDADNGIFKYQSMEAISEKLRAVVEKNKKIHVKTTGGFYGVYSPVGRCGVSSFALRLAKEEENSLLVKLENFREDTSSTDDSFMYYLLSHNAAIGRIIGDMQEYEGLRIVEGPLSYQDIRELKRADVEWFKGYVSDSGCLKRVVFDIGSGALGGFDVLMAFDTVYVPCNSCGKLESFKQLIGYGSGDGYEELIKFIDEED
jgi:hypothetical protein